MRWLKRFGYVVAVLLALIGALYALGASLPVGHRAVIEGRVSRPPDIVWNVVTDFDSAPEWRSDLNRVEHLDAMAGDPVVREHRTTGPLTFRIVEHRPPRRLVSRIIDPNLPFGGTWTWEIEPAGGGSRVRITEDGEIYNPFFRALSRLWFGYTGTAETYLADLATRLGVDLEDLRTDWEHT